MIIDIYYEIYYGDFLIYKFKDLINESSALAYQFEDFISI